MRFLPKIPISIRPAFWFVAGFIGWFYSQSFSGAILFMGLILISVLVHELGHALTALFFGQHPRIELIAFGGLTSFQGKNLSFGKQFLVTFNGPFFGFLLYLVCYLVLKMPWNLPIAVAAFLELMKSINLYWTLVNLFPVIPLDGGQLLRIALEAWKGVKGFKLSLLIGVIFALGASIFFFVTQEFIIGALFFLFGFQSFDLWRKSRYLSKEDRKAEYALLFEKAERLLQQGRQVEAESLFEEIKNSTHEGLLHVGAIHYIAIIKAEAGLRSEAYELLVPIKDHLTDEILPLFQQLAYEKKNYALVAEMSARTFQIVATEDVAYHSAKAFAMLHQPKAAGGWLKTAIDFGRLSLPEVLKEEAFQNVKGDKEFLHFFPDYQA